MVPTEMRGLTELLGEAKGFKAGIGKVLSPADAG
jgi:hypothetical protein